MGLKNKYLFAFAIILLTVVFCGCKKKKYDDSLPKVEFVSATLYKTDTLLVTGKVTDIGSSAIKYTGFSADTIADTSIINGQVLLQGTSGQFQALIPILSGHTYYLKCFAANTNGYTASGDFKYP